MPEIFIHEKETDNNTESFLNENREKFETDAVFLLRLMYHGKRLSGHQVTKEYGIDSRRLRELVVSHKDIKKEWVLDDGGKRKYVQYFMETPKPPTKSNLQEWLSSYQEEKGETSYHQQQLFP
jgi:hypothetical protein